MTFVNSFHTGGFNRPDPATMPPESASDSCQLLSSAFGSTTTRRPTTPNKVPSAAIPAKSSGTLMRLATSKQYGRIETGRNRSSNGGTGSNIVSNGIISPQGCGPSNAAGTGWDDCWFNANFVRASIDSPVSNSAAHLLAYSRTCIKFTDQGVFPSRSTACSQCPESNL